MHDTERQLRDSLNAHARLAPPSERIVASVRERASVGKLTKRSGWMTPAGAAAAVLIVVGLVVWAVQDRPTSGGSSNVANSQDVPLPAEGQQFFGVGRVVVEVPNAWGFNQVQCNGIPMSDTVVFAIDGGRLCQISPAPRVSSVQVASPDSTIGGVWLSLASPVGKIGDYELWKSNIVARSGFTSQVLAVPEAGFIAKVQSPDGGIVERIGDSITVLPTGYVTVPYVQNLLAPEAESVLKAVGLAMKAVDTEGMSAPERRAVSEDPLAGSVVHVPSTINVAFTTVE
jgi:hypothetical protein